MAKKDDDTPDAPALSGDQLLEAIKLLVQSNRLDTETLAQTMGEMIPTAIAEANMKSRQWWDDRTFNDASPFNPEGERVHPRPEFERDIFWLGYLCQRDQHTREEIELLNQIRPGVFDLKSPHTGQPERKGYFQVRELDPGIPDGRLLVIFPCASEDERSSLARFDRGRGMVDLLLELLPAEKARRAGTAA